MQHPMSSGTSLAVAPPSFAHRGRTRARQLGRGLIAVLGLLVVLGLVGTMDESVAEAADVRAYPPPGQMIDVGGHSLHINCVGTGTPTVVIDAGWGDSSGAWSSWVQPGVARTTRVCTYDRAGMGFSEPCPLPRTAEVFAREYAAEVAGVVLFESMSPRQAKPSTSATPTETDSHSIVDWVVTLPARTGVLRLLSGPLHGGEGLSPEVANYYSAFWVTPRS